MTEPNSEEGQGQQSMSTDRQVKGWPRIWRISPLTNQLEWRVPDRAGWKMFPWRQEDVEYLQAMTAAARDREGLKEQVRELEAALGKQQDALLVLKAWIRSGKEDASTINYEGIAKVVNDGYEAARAYFAARPESSEESAHD